MSSETPRNKVSRRQVLAASSLIAAGAGGFDSQPASSQAPAAASGSNVVVERQKAARAIRTAAGMKSTNIKPLALPPVRPDNRVELYSKGIKRQDADDRGLPTPQAFGALESALNQAYRRTSLAGVESDFANVEALQAHLPEERRFKLTNPLGGLSFDVEGPDSFATVIKDPPDFRSDQTAAEMAELYWMALLRDLPLTAFAPDTLDAKIIEAIDDLNTYPWLPATHR